MTTWTCLREDCPERGDDLTWTAADRAAEQHLTATGHGVSTSTVGSTRVREGGRVVDVRGGGAS